MIGTKFGQSILRKIFIIVATRCHLLRLKCTKFDFGWGAAPQPAWGGYNALPDPSWIWGGLLLRGGRGRGKGGNGKGRVPPPVIACRERRLEWSEWRTAVLGLHVTVFCHIAPRLTSDILYMWMIPSCIWYIGWNDKSLAARGHDWHLTIDVDQCSRIRILRFFQI